MSLKQISNIYIWPQELKPRALRPHAIRSLGQSSGSIVVVPVEIPHVIPSSHGDYSVARPGLTTKARGLWRENENSLPFFLTVAILCGFGSANSY